MVASYLPKQTKDQLDPENLKTHSTCTRKAMLLSTGTHLRTNQLRDSSSGSEQTECKSLINDINICFLKKTRRLGMYTPSKPLAQQSPSLCNGLRTQPRCDKEQQFLAQATTGRPKEGGGTRGEAVLPPNSKRSDEATPSVGGLISHI